MAAPFCHVTGIELGVYLPLTSTEVPFPTWGKNSSRRNKERIRVILITTEGVSTDTCNFTILSCLSWNRTVSHRIYYQCPDNTASSVAHLALCIIYPCSHPYRSTWKYNACRLLGEMLAIKSTASGNKIDINLVKQHSSLTASSQSLGTRIPWSLHFKGDLPFLL